MSNFVEEAPEKLPLKGTAYKLKKIESGLVENLENLRQQLKVIESKPELLSHIEIFRSDMESKANSLEADVDKLREEVKKIKALLGLNLKNQRMKNC